MIAVGGGFATWQSYSERAPNADDLDAIPVPQGLVEQVNITRDSSDYMWYLTQ